jgi:hypothetical protein
MRAICAILSVLLMTGPQFLIECIRFVHLVSFCLLCIQPPLQELSIVFLKILVALFDLSELKLEGADFIM